MRSRFMSDPEDGIEQLLVWLTIDGLFLWQFMGLVESDDPLLPQIGHALRTRLEKRMNRTNRIAAPAAHMQPIPVTREG